jgi:putative selenium metabolism hydrolase
MEERDVISFCQQLVRLPSTSGKEKAVADCTAARMRELRYDRVTIDAWGNVIGEIRGARPGPRLLLDAHMDTVPVGEAAAWTRDPFSGEVEGDCLHGRGSTDDKGCLAAIVSMAGWLDRSRLAGTVYVSGTVNEEETEGAALGKVCQVTHPDLVLIAEGTELRLGVGQKGRASVLVQAHGKQAHASNPTEGVNAVYKMLPALTALRNLPVRQHPLLGWELAELIELISSPYPSNSVVPFHCLARYDYRMMPGETPASLIARWQAVAGNEVEISVRKQSIPCYTGAVLEVEDFYRAWVTPSDGPFATAVRRGLARVDQNPPDFTAHYCSNGSYSGGEASIPTLIYGPGIMQHAHMVNEFVETPQIIAATHGLAAIVESVLA